MRFNEFLEQVTLIVAIVLTGYFVYTNNFSLTGSIVVSVLYLVWTIKHLVKFHIRNNVDLDAELLKRLNDHKAIVEETLKKTYVDINSINNRVNAMEIKVNGSSMAKTVNSGAPRF